MKNKNKLLCLPPIPLLLSIAFLLEYISLLFIVGSLIFLILRSIERKKKKLIVKDSLYWILLILILSAVTFIISTIMVSRIAFYFDASYLLIYVFSLVVLFLGFIILKSFSVVKIKKITLVILGILLLLFIALYCWKIFIGIDNQTKVNGRDGFQAPATTGVTNPIGGGCGSGMSIF